MHIKTDIIILESTIAIIYLKFINNNNNLVSVRFKDWLKSNDFLHNKYNDSILKLRELLKKEKWVPNQKSPIILSTKRIVDILNLSEDLRFAAQVDVIEEVEGNEFMGAMTTSELLKLMIEKIPNPSIEKLISAFGENDNMRSVIFKKSPIKSFLTCGANWKPGSLDLLNYYKNTKNINHAEAILEQFTQWHNYHNTINHNLNTYRGDKFNNFVKIIREKCRFNKDAKMYWIQYGDIYEVEVPNNWYDDINQLIDIKSYY